MVGSDVSEHAWCSRAQLRRLLRPLEGCRPEGGKPLGEEHIGEQAPCKECHSHEDEQHANLLKMHTALFSVHVTARYSPSVTESKRKQFSTMFS